jgi:hypothetical protein
MVAIAAVVVVVGVVLVWFQPQALLFDTVVDEEFPESAEDSGSGADDGAEADAAEADGEAGDGAEAGVGTEGDRGEDGTATAAESVEPELLAAGEFEPRNDHEITGRAAVYELGDGSRTLRLDPFESQNGPVLVVYLTAADHAEDDEALAEDFVDLGSLRGNIGSQNYDVPDEVDLDRYDTAVVWCRRFSVSFGAADLE